MKMRIALYKNVEYDIIGPTCTVKEGDLERVLITDYVEVDFPDREQSDVINSQINALDKAAEELGKKYMEGLESIKRKKAELLAISTDDGVSTRMISF